MSEPIAEPEAFEGDGTGRILVVEDNENVGEHASQLLRDLSYDTSLAPDAKSALRALEETDEPFDLVLTDIVMPGGSRCPQSCRTEFRIRRSSDGFYRLAVKSAGGNF